MLWMRRVMGLKKVEASSTVISSTSAYVFALVAHLQRLAVVARPLAHLAGHVNVGQKVHLNLDDTVSAAGFAAAALDVEAEPPFSVSAYLGVGGLGEQLADDGRTHRYSGRVGARRAPDGRLVDVDHLVDQVLNSFDTACGGPAYRVRADMQLLSQGACIGSR
jgi:hypothetical protein